MYRSPTFLGCCFAISVDFFKHLGTYDPGYQIWGAENLELSFKVRLDVNIGDDSINLSLEGVTLRCLTQLSTIFQLYHGGQFIGGGNRRNPPTCRKSLTNFIT